MKNTPPAAAGDEVIVTLKLQFKPGSSDHVLRTFLPAIALTRAEPGNNGFQLFKVAGADDTFIVFERWRDQAALDWHWQQPYTKEVLGLFASHLAKPFSEAEDVTYLSDMAR